MIPHLWVAGCGWMGGCGCRCVGGCVCVCVCVCECVCVCHIHRIIIIDTVYTQYKNGDSKGLFCVRRLPIPFEFPKFPEEQTGGLTLYRIQSFIVFFCLSSAFCSFLSMLSADNFPCEASHCDCINLFQNKQSQPSSQSDVFGAIDDS